MPGYEEVAAKVDEIEAEMRRSGLWGDEAPAPAAFDFKAAFANDTMPLTQWIQWVFIPNVRRIVAERGELPEESMVGYAAYRELEYAPDAEGLVERLLEFDELFAPPTDEWGEPLR